MKRTLSIAVAFAMLVSAWPGLAGIDVASAAPAPIAIAVQSGGFGDTIVAGDGGTTLLWKRGDAEVVGGALRIAPSAPSKGGTVVKRDQVRLTDGFSTYFKFSLHNHKRQTWFPFDEAPADGLAFIAYDNDEVQLGGYGEGLGYLGIDDSIVVEFDTYNNGGRSDPDSNHVAVMLNGSCDHTDQPAGSVETYPAIKTDEIHVWVDYDGTNVEVTFGTSETRTDAANRTIQRDVGDFLEGKDVFVGFSASTGGDYSDHDVLKWNLKDSYVDGGLSSTSSYTQGASTIGINLDRTINPSNATIAVKDAAGETMDDQDVEIYIDDVSEATFNTGDGAYTIPSDLGYGEHTIRAVAAGGASNFEDFTVARTTKSITSFTFEDLTPTVAGSIYETGGTIDLTVPYGTDVTALVPTIVHTGASVAPASGVAQDFTDPVVYTVTAEDTSTKEYTVTVDSLSVPEAPTGVTAEAGNGQVIVRFTPPENDGGSPITGYTVTSNPGGITATGTSTTITVTGLTNGTIYTFTVRATNGSGDGEESAPSSAVRPHRPDRSTDDSPNEPSETGVDILVNGKTETAATATTTKVDDRSVTTITVDDEKVEEKLEREGNNAVVTVPFRDSSDVVIGQLNGQTVRNMETREAVLEIKTANVTYTLPAAEINIDSVSAEMGTQVDLKDITVNITISSSPQDTVRIVEDTANKNNYQVVVTPVEFEVTCTNGGKIVEVSRFNAYVERMVAVPDGIDPSKITTGIVLNPDGTFSHVPTAITTVNGRYYARINSLTNSTYSVIWSPKTFGDAESHWAKEAVNDMASRLVVDGVGDDRFEPDRDITRAEAAAIIVRALGLMRPGTGKDSFTDVAEDAWYYDAVSIASEYGIISGYGGGVFGSNDRITREQAMTMITRAMDITGLVVTLEDGEVDSLLSAFIDSGASADWSKDSIAACVKTEIVSGRSASSIAPKDYITRAELAVIVRRLLQKSDLI